MRLWFALLAASMVGQGLHAQCSLDRAVQLHQSGDLEGAIREYQACVAAEPNRIEVQLYLRAKVA